MITKPTNFVTRQMEARAAELQGHTSLGDLCPDLTAEQVAYLEERYPLPIWDGQEHTRADYHQAVGKYLLVVDLRVHFEAYT